MNVELIYLKINDLNMENRMLKCMGKGSKERIIPFGNKAYQYLNLYLGKVRPKLVKNQDEDTNYRNVSVSELDNYRKKWFNHRIEVFKANPLKALRYYVLKYNELFGELRET